MSQLIDLNDFYVRTGRRSRYATMEARGVYGAIRKLMIRVYQRSIIRYSVGNRLIWERSETIRRNYLS